MKTSRSHINWKPISFLKSGVKVFWLLAFSLGGNWGWGQIITIGSGTFNSFDVPINNLGEYSYAQMIYSASQINAQGVTGSQNITAIQFSYAGATHSGVANNWNLYLGNTTKTNFTSTTDWVGVSNLTQVYSGSVSVPSCGCASTGQWYTVTFSTPFLWDGTSNLVIAVQETNSGHNNPIGHDYTSSSPTFVSITSANSSLINPSSPGIGTRSTMLPNIRITFSPACSPPTSQTISSNSPICAGSTLNLTGSATGATSYSWLGPNGFFSSTQNPSINPATTAASGTYFLTAQNSCGTGSGVFDNFSDNNFTSNPVWTPQPNTSTGVTPTTWSTGVSNLIGSTTNTEEVISTQSTQTFGTWKFDFTMAQINNSNAIISFVFLSNLATLNGGQGYYLSVRGNPTTTSSVIYLRRYNGTIAQFGDANNILLGSYNWNGDLNPHSLTVTRATNGVFRIYLDNVLLGTTASDLTYTTSDFAGFYCYSSSASINHAIDNIICSSTLVDVTVNPLPTTPSAITGTTSICPSTATTYSVTNVAGVTYNWSYSGTGTITGSGNSISLSATTEGTLSVTASNSCGTSVASSQAITMTPPILWANTKSPASGVSCSNDNFNVYGQVYIPGITDNSSQGANVTAQLGYSTTNPDPSTWTNWVNATYNSAVTGNNDEYMGTLTGLTGNTYYYAFRYSYNGCAYVYGGYSAPNASSNIWIVNTPSNSGVFIGNSNSNGSPGSSGINTGANKAFGLWSSGGTSEAIRNFPSLLIGQTLRFDMDNGNVNNGGTIGVGLQNSSGQNVWEIYFSGGTSSYVINSGSVSPAVNIPFTANGLRISFTLTSATTYSATIQTLNGGTTYGPYTGSLLNPTGGQSLTRFRAFNFNSGSGSDKDFFINSLVTPSFYDDASAYSSLSNGLQSTTSVGGIWNSPTIGNGTLTVTTAPTTASAGTTQTICEGNTVTLTSNAPSVGTGAWTIISGPNTNTNQLTSTSANNPVFTPTAAGNYTLVWTITNGSCTSTSNVIITVTSGILNFVNTQSPASTAICQGSNTTIYGQVYEPSLTEAAGAGTGITAEYGYSSSNSNPNGNDWTWTSATYFGQGGTGNNNDEYSATFGSSLGAGTYYYAFRYRLNGCAWQYGGYSATNGGTWNGTTNVNGILTISATPTTASAGSTQTICEGNTVTLTSNTPSVGTGAWSIFSGPNTNTNQLTSTSANNPVFTPTAAGNYTLVWTITNGSCTSTSNVTITVTSGILNFVNVQTPTFTICSGASQLIYGQVYEPGLTDTDYSQGAGITVEYGFSSSNTNPNTWPSTVWTTATYNTTSYGNNDEYSGNLYGLSSGTYYYAFRYKLNCGAWQYGGTSGSWSNNSGILYVNDCYGSFGSAVYMQTCSNNVTSNTFFRTEGDISANNFTNNNFGSYYQNSGALKIQGGEVKTWKAIGANVCTPSLYYRVYPIGNPTGAYSPITLPFYENCSGTAFASGDPCTNIRDQKWQRPGLAGVSSLSNIDLTTYSPGTYQIEVYYDIPGNHSGTSGCSNLVSVNNSGANYKASFTIVAAPSATNTGPYCVGNTIQLNASSASSYSWSGPNSFSNSTQNPTIAPATSAMAGIYTITAALANGCTQTATTTVVINAPTIPTFNQIAAICTGGSLTALPTTSTNGISGTWSPALNNSATTTYTFTPSSGTCVGTTTMTITVNTPPNIDAISPP